LPGANDPVDQISLRFGRIEVDYRPQRLTVSFGATVKAGWDGQKNAKI
jgi:type VI protein secretion system component Hcp